ncbi:MAG: ATP-binding protein [Crocinitomicaceae bacterium]|nr:ATP-binding protein [Crocinitomicaceae bacterium]MDG1776199.1 ATP-binding protein [Crocinitomicaceae bacterium]
MLKRSLKKYYILVAALLCSLLFGLYFFKTFSENYTPSIEKFQVEFSKAETALETALRLRSNEIKQGGITQQWKKINTKDAYNLHVYHKDSLVFWNTNQIPIIRFAEIHFPSEGFLHLQNGWYYAKMKAFNDYVVCASMLVKQDYSYKNNELVNGFAPNLSLPFSSYISLEEDVGHPIYSNSSRFVFSILPKPYQEATSSESITMLFLLLASIALWLFALARLVARFTQKWGWIVLFSVLIFRAFSLRYSFFGFMHGTDAFSPSLYGTNQWLPNFFEYLVNVAVVIFALHFLSKRLLSIRKSRINRYIALATFIVSFSGWFMILFLTKGLVENSSIPLVIDELFSLNVYSALALISLGALFFAYFKFVRSTVEACQNQLITGAQLAVVSFMTSVSFFFFEISYGYQLFLASLFPLVFYELVLYLVYRNKQSNQLTTGIILLLLFSVITAANIGSFNERKERGERELYASQLVAEKNIITEIEYASIKEKIADDKYLKRLISYPKALSMSKFQAGMERRFYNGFWERYEMEFHFFDENCLPLIDKRKDGTRQYDELQGILDRSGTISELDSNIFFINDYTNQYSYVIRQHILGRNGERGVLFCTLKSKKIPEEIGFPRLLISSKANVFESLESYSIAKFHNGKLITKYGGFNYPSSYHLMIPTNLNQKGFFDYMGYNHYALKKSETDLVMLSTKKLQLVDYITSFSYLFTLYGLLLLPLLFRMNSEKGFSKTLTLALKIQVVLISLVFLSLFAFGWGAGVFVSNQYNELTDDVIKEKLNSVETEVKSKLARYEELTISENGNYMQVILQKFAKVFFTDINMYDKEGYLLATSRPKVFNVGLISEQMNPKAFKHLKFLQQSEFVHLENIGELHYSSAYKPFYSSTGNLLGYINLQHFGQQREFENQIQDFLVAIVNVFILLLAISIILAIFISNWLTAPLRLLQSNFASVKFGKHNEQILYDKEDEIGALVKDYNKKLDELEYTAQQLARSERELAWREMAKQVAHEIKNPLTPMKLSVQQLLRTYDHTDPNSGDKLKKVANSIVEQIDALTKIANEFSTFAKMPNPSEEKLDIVSLIQGVIEVFNTDLKTSITFNSAEKEVFMLADKDQFVRVFNNLFKNAIQAIPGEREGKIVVDLAVEHGVMKVAIHDNGIGIPKQKHEKIFVPYFTTKSTGTGLGLAMIKQIIENHKGEIRFESALNLGTTFYIKLPIADR